MNNRDIMSALADVHNRLYRTAFSGDQVHVVSDCMKILRATLDELNKTSAEDNVAEASI